MFRDEQHKARPASGLPTFPQKSSVLWNSTIPFRYWRCAVKVPLSERTIPHTRFKIPWKNTADVDKFNRYLSNLHLELNVLRSIACLEFTLAVRATFIHVLCSCWVGVRSFAWDKQSADRDEELMFCLRRCSAKFHQWPGKCSETPRDQNFCRRTNLDSSFQQDQKPP